MIFLHQQDSLAGYVMGYQLQNDRQSVKCYFLKLALYAFHTVVQQRKKVVFCEEFCTHIFTFVCAESELLMRN